MTNDMTTSEVKETRIYSVCVYTQKQTMSNECIVCVLNAGKILLSVHLFKTKKFYIIKLLNHFKRAILFTDKTQVAIVTVTFYYI